MSEESAIVSDAFAPRAFNAETPVLKASSHSEFDSRVSNCVRYIQRRLGFSAVRTKRSHMHWSTSGVSRMPDPFSSFVSFQTLSTDLRHLYEGRNSQTLLIHDLNCIHG